MKINAKRLARHSFTQKTSTQSSLRLQTPQRVNMAGAGIVYAEVFWSC